MKIESVDLFYLSMPQIHDIADGSQDALLVRIQGGGHTGWGECEASPLVSIANWCCPMSHAACRPLRDAVLGETLDSPNDIRRINHRARQLGLDIAQTDHTLSGIDIALWDLLAKHLNEPVYTLLGHKHATAKTPYASVLFGDDPEQTHQKAAHIRRSGHRAVKFGWGPYGQASPQDDREHVAAAREGFGTEGMLMVDAGTIWFNDVTRAQQRIADLETFNVLWLEEPFVGGAINAYGQLAKQCKTLKLAGGEGAHDFFSAQHLIDHGGLGFVQIDTGRIGGITTAQQVADYALAKNTTYVNHTFTTHLALSASLQPFASHPEGGICEYPFEASSLAQCLTQTPLQRDPNGMITLPDKPGLGVDVDEQAIQQYRVDVRIDINGKPRYQSPKLDHYVFLPKI